MIANLDEIAASIELARGTAFMNYKIYPSAIDEFEKIVLHFPYNATVYVNLAKCNMDDDPEEAEFWLKQALILLVEQDYARYLLGMTYEKMGQINWPKKSIRLLSKRRCTKWFGG